MSDREGEISYDIPYVWNLKRNDANELIYKIETDSQPLAAPPPVDSSHRVLLGRSTELSGSVRCWPWGLMMPWGPVTAELGPQRCPPCPPVQSCCQSHTLARHSAPYRKMVVPYCSNRPPPLSTKKQDTIQQAACPLYWAYLTRCPGLSHSGLTINIELLTFPTRPCTVQPC